jgi:hypothetical protein
VGDDYLGDTRCVCAGAASPEADSRTAHAQIEIAIDDSYNETDGAYDL